MLILIRKTTLDGAQVIGQTDVELRKSKISIGTRPDADITLYGEDLKPHHCELQCNGNSGFVLACARGATVSVAERQVDRAELQPGARCRIGPHRLSCINAPPGFDAALEIEIDAEAIGSSRLRYADDIALPAPPLRKLAWAGALLVLAVGLVLPLLSHYLPDTGKTLVNAGLPSDHFWLSGPLDSAHQLTGIGDQCSSCHVKAFEMVSDETCGSCHDSIQGHFTADHPDWPVAELRCAGCHREHNEPGNLVIGHDGVCTDCHKQPQQRFNNPHAKAEVAVATAFTAGQHPQFLVSMLQPQETGWQRQRHHTVTDQLAEQSNLKFPHDVHLDPETVRLEGSDSALACADCHSLARDGEHFLPISMETSCGGCHSLAFDPDQPQREMSHAAPGVVYRELQEYYIAQAAATADGEPRMRKLRRAPGKAESVEADNSEPCRDSVRACGLRAAAEEMQRLFEHTGCVTCHEVKGSNTDWRVAPVKLNDDWYTGSDFNHRPHLNPALGDPDGQCLGCHAADMSGVSSDVLIPGLDNCLQCHDAAANSSSKLMCLECHGFHNSSHGLMRPSVMDRQGASAL